jgi:hypothetical protein
MTYEEVNSYFENFFKSKKIKYSNTSGPLKLNYEFYIGSLEIAFDIEVILEEDECLVEEIIIHLTVSDDVDSYYENDYSEILDGSELFVLEEIYEQLLELSKVIPKIKAKAKELEELCEEHNLYLRDFLVIN